METNLHDPLERMDLLLLFPPLDMLFSFPELGMPHLMSYLTGRGYAVAQRDLNASFIREHLYTAEVFPGVQDRIRRRLPLLKDAELLEAVGEEAFLEPGIMTSRRINTHIVTYLAFAAAYTRLIGVGGFEFDLRRVVQAVDNGDALFEAFFGVSLESAGLDRAAAVGLSIVSPNQVAPALLLSAMIKAIRPETPVIWGGPWCTASEPPHFQGLELLFRHVDYLIAGEGEEPLERLLEALARGSGFSDIPGLCYLRGGELSVNPVAHHGLDHWPTPSFDGLVPAGEAPPRLPVLIAKGCYWARCTFCNHLFRHGRYRARSAGTVVGQIQQLVQRYDAVELDLSCHSASHRQLHDIARELLQRKVQVRWSAMARADKALAAQTFEDLHAAGCRELLFGLECYPQDELDRLDKGIRLEDLEACLRRAHQAGIQCMVFILNYPGQTPAAFQATLDYILSLRPQLAGFIPQRFMLARYMGGPANPGAAGVTAAPGSAYDIRSFSLPHARPPGDLSRGEYFKRCLACHRQMKAGAEG